MRFKKIPTRSTTRTTSRAHGTRALLESLESRTLLASNPIGYIDVANRSILAGWTLDQDEGPLPMNVEITINGTLYTTLANQYRPDLVPYFGFSYHGWSFTPPTTLPTGASSLAVDAVNTATGERTRLGERTLHNPAPVFAVEEASSTRLRGYVFDSDKPTGGTKIRIDIDGVLGTPFAATVARSDLLGTLGTANVGFYVTGSYTGKVVEIYSIDDPSNTATRIWTNNQTPYGSLDFADSTIVFGWAFDPDAPEKAVNIRIDIDGVAGTPFAAGNVRADLQSYLGTSAHGFVKNFSDLTPGSHTASIYMLDPEVTTATPVLLRTIVLTNQAPTGVVDSVNSTQIQGWAYDADLGAAPVNVRVYVDDFLFTTVAAGNTRNDLLPYFGSANHGYSINLSSLDPGSHSITVTVEDNRSSVNDETVIFDGFINNTAPYGFFDSISHSTLFGWVQDPDAPTSSIDVDIYIDNVYVGTSLADITRSDLIPYVGSANHGFAIDLPPLSFGTHTISVYAAESQGTVSTLIGSKTVTNLRPTGSFDFASSTTIWGWAADYDLPSTPLDILVYINGVPTLSESAGNARADLIPYFGNADHGFNITLPVLSAGTYQIDLYALDKNNGLRTNIGSRIITLG